MIAHGRPRKGRRTREPSEPRGTSMFDTHAIARNLTDSGLEPEQASA